MVKIFLTPIGPILFERSKRAKRVSISVRSGRVRVAVPKGVSFKQAHKFVLTKTNWIKKCLQKMEDLKNNYQTPVQNQKTIDRITAKAALIYKLEFLARKYGFTYNRVFIKNQRTIWGSCSNKNNINLNYKLYSLPDSLQEYVMLHELVHLKIKNHSKDFWNELARYCPDYKIRKKELKHYRIELM